MPNPRHIEYWLTSDGRSFSTKEEAEQWEKIIANPDYHKSYTISSDKRYTWEDQVFWIG